MAKEGKNDENWTKGTDNVIGCYFYSSAYFTIILSSTASILGQDRSPINPMRLFTAAKIVNYRIDCALTIPKLFQGNIY